jgi:predicted nucleotidyltransferase
MDADAEVKRVLLYGSLIPGRTITRQSDIDLLIDGGELSRALTAAEESEFPVDVLRVEDQRTVGKEISVSFTARLSPVAI